MNIVFPKLKPWQQVVYDDLKDARGSGRIFVVKAKRQVGKTALATIIIILYALSKKSSICLVEPSLSQSRGVFKAIGNYLKKTGQIVSANASTLTMDFANGSEIKFRSAEQGDNLRGMTLDLLIVDEGAFITDDVYELLFPCVDAKRAPVLIISTPLFQEGTFYRLYTSSETTHYDWSKYDTSCFLSAEKLEYYRSTLSPNKFKTEYLGEFITDGSFVFGNVRSAIKSEHSSPVYAGIDWATGNDGDYTVVTLLDDKGRVTEIDSFKDLDAVTQVDRIASFIKRHPTVKKVRVEMNSIGSVYYDHLVKKLDKGMIDKFTTTNESKRRIIEQLVTAFQTGKIGIPDDYELISELQHYAIEKTSKGYTYNGVSGYNDDYVMSLAFAYDYIVNNAAYKVSVKKRKKYDPHPLITKYN